MITNFSFGVPGEITDADFPMPLGDYFDIGKQVKYMIINHLYKIKAYYSAYQQVAIFAYTFF